MEKWEEREVRRNHILKEAVHKADTILMDGSDGSVEELNYLTALFTKIFVEKTIQPFHSLMLRKDLEDDHRVHKDS